MFSSEASLLSTELPLREKVIFCRNKPRFTLRSTASNNQATIQLETIQLETIQLETIQLETIQLETIQKASINLVTVY